MSIESLEHIVRNRVRMLRRCTWLVAILGTIIDQTVQMSFSLALDQVRFAIASRRAMLLEQGGADAKSGTSKAAAA
jgi:hypothetical protein